MSRGDGGPDDIISIGHEDLDAGDGPSAKPPPIPRPSGQQWAGQPTRWFVARTSIGDRTVRGPYEEQVIKQMLQWGQLAWEDHVSRGGNDPWRPIVHVPEFAQAPDLPSPAPPLPAQGGVPPLYGTLGPAVGRRHNVVAGLLAIFLGGWGAHKFYNGSWGWGIVYAAYLLFFGVPVAVVTLGFGLPLAWMVWLVALVEGILYLVDAARYDQLYNQTPPHPWKW